MSPVVIMYLIFVISTTILLVSQKFVCASEISEKLLMERRLKKLEAKASDLWCCNLHGRQCSTPCT